MLFAACGAVCGSIPIHRARAIVAKRLIESAPRLGRIEIGSRCTGSCDFGAGEGAAPKPQRKDVPGAFDAKRLEGMLGGCKIVCTGRTAYLPRYSLASFIARRPEFTAQAACEPGANLTS